MSPMSDEELSALTSAVTKGINDSKPPGKIVDASGHRPLREPKPWWQRAVPTWVTGSLLGGILGVGVAWGGIQVANAERDKKISAVEASAEKREARLRSAELETAALKAGNTAQHEALNANVKDVKNAVADLKKDMNDKNAALEAKMDAIYKVVKKL